MKLEQKIRLFRDLQGYSQEYVANKLKISHTAYAKMETGKTKITPQKLQEIANILEVSPEDIESFEKCIIIKNPMIKDQIINDNGTAQNFCKIQQIENITNHERESYLSQIEYLKTEIKKQDDIISFFKEELRKK